MADSLVSTDDDRSRRNLTTLVYALHAAAFFVGLTGVVGVIINYLKRDEVAGTRYESHFIWQIRTFWASFGVGMLGVVLIPVFGLGFLVLLADAVWVVYRIVKGWLALNDGKAIDTPRAWI